MLHQLLIPAIVLRRGLDWRSIVTAALAIIAAGVIAAYLALYGGYLADDAYIHLRIARQFVETGYPYYNTGEAVAGSSSPLWTVVLAIMVLIAGPTPGILPWLTGAAIIGLGAVLSVLLAERWGWPWAVPLAWLIVAVSPLSVAAEGMESPLALLWWAFALLAWRRSAWGWLGVWSALAFATRLEFALWLGWTVLLVGGRPRWRVLLGAGGPLTAFAIYHLGFFGTLLPQTVMAKSRVYALTFSESLMTGLLDLPSAIVLVLVAGMALLLAWRQRAPRWVVAAAGFGISLFALYIARRTFLFPWYLPLFVTPIILAVLWVRGRAAIVLIPALLAACLGYWLPLVHETRSLMAGDASGFRAAGMAPRVATYLRIGADLQREFPDARVFTPEIGALGWTFRGAIIDGVGLVSPDVVPFHPLPVGVDRSSGWIGAMPPAAIATMRPEIVVSMPVFGEAFRREVDAGRLAYRRLRVYPLVHASMPPGWGVPQVEVWLYQP